MDNNQCHGKHVSKFLGNCQTWSLNCLLSSRKYRDVDFLLLYCNRQWMAQGTENHCSGVMENFIHTARIVLIIIIVDLSLLLPGL